MPLPIAHATAGLTAYFLTPKEHRQSLSRKNRNLLLLLVISLAITPDLDLLPGILIGKPNIFHHNESHSIVSALTIATAVWLISKTYFAECSNRTLFLLIFTATSSHLLLDYFSSDSSFPYGIPLLWPFSEKYFIAPFPLFRDVSRLGGSNAVFFHTLLNENNFWEILLELLFLALTISLLYGAKGRNKPLRLLSMPCALICGIGYYALQIEPNWIETKKFIVSTPKIKSPTTVVLLSDLHLSTISFREKRLKSLLKEIAPDVLLFSGDTFEPIKDKNKKIRLPNYFQKIFDYLQGLPGSKYLVWGEGVFNSRHLINKKLSSLGVHVLEDESQFPAKDPQLLITGKLPEQAYFRSEKATNKNSYLSAGDSRLNSYLHYNAKGSLSWKNYIFTGSFFLPEHGGTGLTFYSNYSKFSDRFYRIRPTKNLQFTLAPHGTGSMDGKSSTSPSFAANSWYNFKILTETHPERTVIKARFWTQGEQEPQIWQINCWDKSENRLQTGTIGVWVGGISEKKMFDNFEIKSSTRKQTLLKEDFNTLSLWQQEKKFDKIISSPRLDTFNILLSHSAEIIYDYSIEQYDMILAGDTHGGQVCWPWGQPVLRDKKLPSSMYSGLHPVNNNSTELYVTRGIGTSRLPIRLFCRPEITVFEIVPAQAYHIQTIQ